MLSQAVLADFYMIILFIAAMITMFLVVFSWRRRVIPGASYSAAMNFFIFLWVMFTILDWTSPNQDAKYFWNQIGYICVGFLPMSWLAFSLKFTHKNWFSPIYMLALSIIPAFVLYLAFKGDLWTERHYSFIEGSLLNIRYLYQEVKFSGWVYVSIAFAYILNVSGTVNIIYSVIRNPQRYQQQGIALIINAAVAPLMLNAIYNFHLIPNWTMDLTPLGFAISSTLLTYALFRHRLLNLIPFARDTLVDIMSDGLIVMDLNDNVLDINPAAQTITQQPQVRAIGKSLFSVLPTIRKYPFNGEISLTINQVVRYYDVKSSSLYNQSSGLVEGHMLMLRDITTRKDTEVKLSRSEEIFRSLIEQSHDGVMLIDHQGHITIWNQSMQRITGIYQQDILGHYVWDLVEIIMPEKDNMAINTRIVKEGFLDLIANHPSFLFDPPLELPIRMPVSGELRFIQNVTFPINTSSGTILGSITRDVTQAKRNENQIKQLYEESKGLQQEAEAASNAKSQFLAVMSHELRTPMNAVIGMIQLLLDTSLSPKQLDYADTIRSSGDTLLSLINDILDYSKIESGKMELEIRPFNLRSVIEESFDLVAQQASKKGLELIYIMGSSVPRMLQGDPTRLRQILTNLMGNAVKFTDKGEVKLSVRSAAVSSTSTEAHAQNKIYQLHFDVRDTGIGISRDKISRLFQTFSQIDQSTTRVYGGTGLGLAISKRLAEAMGGSMSVISEPGKGSTFTFTIQVQSAPSAQEEIESRFRELARGKSVLVYDDNAGFLRMVSRRLRLLGMVVNTTAMLETAGNMLNGRKDPFDLVIFDCTPMSAERALALAKIQLLAASSRLVLLTDQQNSIMDESLLKKASAVMNKPLKYYHFLNTLIQILSGKAVSLPLLLSTSGIEALGSEKLPLLGPQHPLRILMVEDNHINQKVIISAMERLGYRAKIANNGFECLEMMHSNIYDVIFMDVQMAEMDGLDTTRRIRREWPVDQQPRIVALTAAAMIGDRSKCLEAGMDDYISKPLRLPELTQALINSSPISPFEPESFIFIPEDEEKAQPPAPSTVELAFVDRKAIRELLNTLGKNKIALVTETIDIFISESGDFMDGLKTALKECDLETMRRMVHTLKSTTASLGALTLSARCKVLEAEIRVLLDSPDPALPAGKFDQQVAQISAGFFLVSQELLKVKAELPSLAEKD